tara:strand:- start:10152 stop:10943 length:792 start_codon:yes stop_codon:yes gene_type:complete
MTKKIRLDLHLLTKGIVSTRQKAQQLIRAGMVRDISGKLLDKPGQEVYESLELVVKKSPRFVSRGGEKLLKAFEEFPIQVKNKICIDGGISTGGFTDCLLQHGAKKVYGIDVGYGQTAWNIRQDPRVSLHERTNLRTLTAEKLYAPNESWANFVVLDVSFISIELILPSIKYLVNSRDCEVVLLIKPQFEVGRGLVSKGGVVKDKKARAFAVQKVIKAAQENQFQPKGLLESPLIGPAGNHEYLFWASLNEKAEKIDISSVID